jgi:hypothetical protein
MEDDRLPGAPVLIANLDSKSTPSPVVIVLMTVVFRLEELRRP